MLLADHFGKQLVQDVDRLSLLIRKLRLVSDHLIKAIFEVEG